MSDASSRAEHTANVLGALSLVVTDEVRRAVTSAAEQAENDATVLSALEHFLDAPRIDEVARVLGLTSSGTVRLVDRLERAGLVRRSAGDDARATMIALTAAGRRQARRVTRARQAVLGDALAPLTAAERDQLARLMGKVMGSVVRARLSRGPGDAAWTCRLCDMGACRRNEGHCPAANAAAAAMSGA